MTDLSESQLETLCAACGWQGGTYWQVVDEVRRLVVIARAADEGLNALRRAALALSHASERHSMYRPDYKAADQGFDALRAALEAK